MNGNVTTLTAPDDPTDTKSFTYDHSYWSFDGCRERDDGYSEKDPSHPNHRQYADQVDMRERERKMFLVGNREIDSLPYTYWFLALCTDLENNCIHCLTNCQLSSVLQTFYTLRNKGFLRFLAIP